MAVKSLLVTALVGWLSLSQFLLAQLPQFMPSQPPPPPTVFVPDNPSHRYLPPPVGKSSLMERVRALEQLSQSQTSGSPQAELPLGLSPNQLKQLDSILDSFRDEKGELHLPSPDSVPKEWIDRLLPDPKQRQQAKEMLEQYSRSRNIPLTQDQTSSLPPIDSQPRNADSTQQPQQEPANNKRSSNPSDGNRPGSNQSSGSNPPSGTGRATTGQPTGTGQPSGDSPSSSSELPKDVPPQLRQLYETLKQFQQQQQQQQATRPADANAGGSRGDAASNRNGSSLGSDQRNNRTMRPGPAARPPASASRGSTTPKPNTTAPRFQPPNTPRGQSMNGQGQQPPLPQPGVQPGADNDTSANSGIDQAPDGKNAIDKNSTNDVSRGLPADPLKGDSLPGGDKAANKGNTPDANSSTLTPFDEGFDFSKDNQVPVNPFMDPDNASGNSETRKNEPSRTPGSANKPLEPFNVTRMAQDPRFDPRSSSNANGQDAGNQAASKPGFDLRKSVNELGLGPALKRIIEKTIEKQGLDASQVKDKNDSKVASNTPSMPSASSSAMPSPQATEQLKNWAESVAKSSSTSTNDSSSPANAPWGKWLRDTWQAVADAPTRSQGSSSSSAAASPSASLGQLPEFRWTGSMTAAVIIFAALVGLLLWFSRRAVTEASDVTSAQAEWVRTVMAQGLKTRADVIRAFHHLVKQSRSVSDWWTHRSIVRYFSAQTPQLATAIDELAIVYEQARYYPEDVELSPQQLAQVRTLLESVKIPTASRDK